MRISIVAGYWLPRSDYDGSKVSLKWVATHVPAPRPVALTFDADLDAANGSSEKKRILKVTDKDGRTSQPIEFVKPLMGHITTDLEASEKQKLRSWLTPLLTDAARRARGDRLRLEVAGEKANDRQRERIANTRSALQSLITELAPAKDYHPGLDDAQNPRQGVLDPDVVVNMAESTGGGRMVVDLPNANAGDPGRLVGPDNATTCPVSVTLRYHSHGSGLGTTYKDSDLLGDLLIVHTSTGELCTADTILHELGHLFGLSPFDIAKDGFAPGIDKCKGVGDGEVDPWKHKGDKGHLYKEHGHTGSHCAWGLDDTQKATADYSDSSNVPRGVPECVMFGAGPSEDANRQGSVDLCPQCHHLMRARDYSKF